MIDELNSSSFDVSFYLWALSTGLICVFNAIHFHKLLEVAYVRAMTSVCQGRIHVALIALRLDIDSEA